MATAPLPSIHRRLTAAVDELGATTAGASDDELLSVLTLCEGLTRRLDRLVVDAISTLQRRGTFTDRGYRTTAAALSDLLGWERFEARRRVTAAEQVGLRVGLDGTTLPARLPATAEAFAAGAITLRHVEVVAAVLATPAAHRLTPEVWAGAEVQLAARAAEYRPGELHTWGSALLDALDQDGAPPDDESPHEVNELQLRRHRTSSGGTITGRFEDAAMFDAIATAVDALAAPRSSDDHRGPDRRQAEALADICGYVLDHGDVPDTGGRRPHLSVLVRLEDLENRARAAFLDFGGALSPAALRHLCCDAAVVPVVLDGTGQPLDVGRATRTIPDGLRRAVTARDRGCAHPGCTRPPSWCEIHHIREWANGGETVLGNLVMLCRVHHRQLHHSAWTVRIRDGLPEFIPPGWIDPQRRPRRKPLLHLARAG